MKSNRLRWKWLSVLLSVPVFVAALAPGLLRIPLDWQPWIFLGMILWIMLVITGVLER